MRFDRSTLSRPRTLLASAAAALMLAFGAWLSSPTHADPPAPDKPPTPAVGKARRDTSLVWIHGASLLPKPLSTRKLSLDAAGMVRLTLARGSSALERALRASGAEEIDDGSFTLFQLVPNGNAFTRVASILSNPSSGAEWWVRSDSYLVFGFTSGTPVPADDTEWLVEAESPQFSSIDPHPEQVFRTARQALYASFVYRSVALSTPSSDPTLGLAFRASCTVEGSNGGSANVFWGSQTGSGSAAIEVWAWNLPEVVATLAPAAVVWKITSVTSITNNAAATLWWTNNKAADYVVKAVVSTP